MSKTKKKTNKDYINIFNELSMLMAISTKRSFNQQAKEGATVVTIDPSIEIPNSIAYMLISAKRALSPIIDEGTDIEEKITEEVKSRLKKETPTAENSDSTNEDGGDSGLENDFNERVKSEIEKEMNKPGGLYDVYLKSSPTKQIEFKKCRLSIGKSKDKFVINLKEEDPEGKFKLSYLADSLIDTIFFIEP